MAATTMRDIARAAQVDPSVVSAVLNNSKTIRVSSVKRDLVLSLAQEMDYRPNLSARSLSTRKSHSIGVLFFSVRDRFYAEMMAEIQQQLIHRGYVGIYAFWNDESEVSKAYDTVLSRGVDGIITCHNQPALFPPGIPTVTYNAYLSGHDGVSCNYENALRNSLQYLMGLGHRRIGFLCSASTDLRTQCFKKLMPELGLELNPEWLMDGNGFFNDASQLTVRLLSQKRRPTALIARNDVTAMAALWAARQLKIAVPEELSLIGYDNIEEASYSFPRLTTNGCPLEKIVEQLIEALFWRMENPSMPPRKRVLEMELIIRESCMAVS